MKTKPIALAVIALVVWCVPTFAKTVRYELKLEQRSMNLSGHEAVSFALSVNGSIPGPTLEFTEGDDAEVLVKNLIPAQEASIHWHGILLPPEMDGVPHISFPPIPSGGSFLYRFKIRQHGTYWYHSHTMTQEQEGVYGALIIHPKYSQIQADLEQVVVLGDWSDEPGASILENLKKDGDYYQYKKGTLRSWTGALSAGKFLNQLNNEWTRMGGMDPSDVGYDAFLMNGMKDPGQMATLHPGQKLRLRVINGAASTFFKLSFGGLPMRVVSADGQDVSAVSAREISIGMAETYDLLLELPEHRNYEFKAASVDGTGSVSAWIGMGSRGSGAGSSSVDLYQSMDHSHHGSHANDQRSKAEQSIDPLGMDQIQAQHSTVFKGNLPIHELHLTLGGDMRRYVWHLNGQTIQEDRNLLIRQGELVRLTFDNQTMMHHPMHLHGHFFRVLTQAGERSPLKHTVDVPPFGTRTIEFLADEPGEWMLHCHNLFHMSTGMARVVKYEGYEVPDSLLHLQHLDHHRMDPWFWSGNLDLATHHFQARVLAQQTWNQVEARVETRNTAPAPFSYSLPWETEADLLYHRWSGSYFHWIAGGVLVDGNVSAAGGLGYLLPFMIESQILLDHRGHPRLRMERRFQLSRTFLSDVDLIWRPGPSYRTAAPLEYEWSFMYQPDWAFGTGIMLTDRSVGFGVHSRF